jgi:hypothetical protein
MHIAHEGYWTTEPGCTQAKEVGSEAHRPPFGALATAQLQATPSLTVAGATGAVAPWKTAQVVGVRPGAVAVADQPVTSAASMMTLIPWVGWY